MKIIDKRKLPVLVVAFLICQVIVDCLNTVTLFPFLHYGMFSGSFKMKEIETFEVKVNNTVLTADKFGILSWDMIHFPLMNFRKFELTQDYAFDKNEFHRRLDNIGLNKFWESIAHNVANDPNLNRKFPLWYKTHLAKVINEEIKHLEVSCLYHSYINGSYILQRRIKWIEI